MKIHPPMRAVFKNQKVNYNKFSFTYNNAGVDFILFKPIVKPEKFLVLSYDSKFRLSEIRQRCLKNENK